MSSVLPLIAAPNTRTYDTHAHTHTHTHKHTSTQVHAARYARSLASLPELLAVDVIAASATTGVVGTALLPRIEYACAARVVEMEVLRCCVHVILPASPGALGPRVQIIRVHSIRVQMPWCMYPVHHVAARTRSSCHESMLWIYPVGSVSSGGGDHDRGPCALGDRALRCEGVKV